MSATFRVTNEYTRGELCTWWQAISADPTNVGTLMDNFPKDLDEFLVPVHEGKTQLWLLLVEETIVGAHWNHDIGILGYTNTCWTAGWRLPTLRGLGPEPRIEVNRLSRAQGFEHFFGACRLSNRVAQRSTAKAGYHYIMPFPKFGWFEGELDDVILLATSNEPDVVDVLLDQASYRATQHRRQRP